MKKHQRILLKVTTIYSAFYGDNKTMACVKKLLVKF